MYILWKRNFSSIYKIAFNHESLGLPKEFIANNVLPFLWPLSIDNGLTVQQYKNVMMLIKELSESVESEHVHKLQHLSKDESSSLQLNLSTSEKQNVCFASDSTSSIKKIHLKPVTHHGRDNLNCKQEIISPTSSNNACSTPWISYAISQTTDLQPQRTYLSTSFNMNSISQPHFFANAESSNSVSLSSSSLLQPAKVMGSNEKRDQKTILTKEDILEFLK
ncbi:uncharacterized protein LOC129726803 [Wyeomyia smithii]|uniref:uncharacterized protein LOC129726803 n=1 Tax=Wyeomyia smithii TaxID=174621 RepID=UPI002467C7C4|nr:uncharacterized protein LOC129726803 [Wyeomyia smithii]